MTTTTISREQHDYADEQVRRAGLSDRVTVLMEDYRELRGPYDKLDRDRDDRGRRLAGLPDLLRHVLGPAGSRRCDLLQAITIDDRAYEVDKAAKSLHQHRHLPRRMPALVEEMARDVGRPPDLQAVGLEDLRRTTSAAAALAPELPARADELAAARLRRALPPAVDALPRLLRGGLRRAADLRRPAAADQAPVADYLTQVPTAL